MSKLQNERIPLALLIQKQVDMGQLLLQGNSLIWMTMSLVGFQTTMKLSLFLAQRIMVMVTATTVMRMRMKHRVNIGLVLSGMGYRSGGQL